MVKMCFNYRHSGKKLLLLTSILLSCAVISAQEFLWYQREPMPSPGLAPSACVFDGKVFVFGGDMDGAVNGSDIGDSFLHVYDTENGIWSERKPLPLEICMHGTALVDSVIYMIGGGWFSSLNTNFAYSPSTDTWVSKTSMLTPRGALGVCSLNGKIYAIGGKLGDEILAVNEMYDPVTNTWSTMSPMPTPRVGLAVVAAGGKIYAIGGTAIAMDSYNIVEVYDPEKNEWSSAPSMKSSRFGVVAAVIDRYIIVMGGTSSNYRDAKSTVELYDTKSGQWQTIDKLPVATQWAAACAGPGSVFLMGGENRCAFTFDNASIFDIFLELEISEITKSDAQCEEKDIHSAVLFPNPAKHIVTIKYYPDKEEILTLSLFTASGILVHKQVSKHEFNETFSLSLDLSMLPNGVYICMINTGGSSIVRKLIIRK